MSKKKLAEQAAEEAVETAETINTAQEAVAEKQEPETRAAEEPVVYLGPSIEHVVRHGTVFAGGIPAALEEKAKEIPVIRGLIVPISQYAEVAQEIAIPGSRFRALSDTIREKTRR